MLFSERSIWTMVHGIGLGGAALLGLAAALFYLCATRPASLSIANESRVRAFTALMTFTAVMLWLTVLVGTYIIFPPYRAAPPSGMTDLSQFPRALVLANANTVWLHAFAMEIKEHMPWIASMLTTAVAELHFDDPFDIRTDEHSHTHSIWVAPEFIERYRM